MSKYKPYTFVRVQHPRYAYIGEVMSFETPEHTLMVRRVPAHPGTLEEMLVDALTPVGKPRFVHYAIASLLPDLPNNMRGASFPLEMLRVDDATPVNFKLNASDRVATVDVGFGFGTQLLVATATNLGVQRAWTRERWESFGWTVKPVTTERLTTRREH